MSALFSLHDFGVSLPHWCDTTVPLETTFSFSSKVWKCIICWCHNREGSSEIPDVLRPCGLAWSGIWINSTQPLALPFQCPVLYSLIWLRIGSDKFPTTQLSWWQKTTTLLRKCLCGKSDRTACDWSRTPETEEEKEWFSNNCRKSNTKVITPSNHNRSKERDGLIRIPSNYL